MTSPNTVLAHWHIFSIYTYAHFLKNNKIATVVAIVIIVIVIVVVTQK